MTRKQQTDRRSNGTFAPGNPGGPGRPTARQRSAAYRAHEGRALTRHVLTELRRPGGRGVEKC